MSHDQPLIKQQLVFAETEEHLAIERQPSRRLSDAEFFHLTSRELHPAMRQWLVHDLMGLAQAPSSCSQPMLRKSDERIALLSDFYRRASLCDAQAASSATWQGRRVVEILRSRCEKDAQIIEALADGGEIAVMVPVGKGTDCYGLGGATALRRLLWNNLMQHYPSDGMGHILLAYSDEESMAMSLIEQGVESLFFAFANRSVLLQIDSGTRLFIHGMDSANVRSAADTLQRPLMRACD